MPIWRAYGEGEALGIAVGGILLVEHIIEGGDLAVGVRNLTYTCWYNARVNQLRGTHNRELDRGRGELGAPLLNILGPLVVVLEAVGRDADDLHIALLEVRLPARQLAEPL